jgi:hypothetical protein
MAGKEGEMKVIDLIHELNKYPDDVQVCIQQNFPDPEVDYAEIYSVDDTELVYPDDLDSELIRTIVIKFE